MRVSIRSVLVIALVALQLGAVSTIILSCGMGVTILSALPMVDLFGRVSILVLVTALIGDVLFLPALLRVVEGWRLGPADQPAVAPGGKQTPAG